MTRSAHREAVASFEQALDALSHLPERRDTIEQAVDIRIDLRHALIPLGELERALDHLRAAETFAEALEDQRRLGWISCYMTHYFWLMGDHGRVTELAQRTLAIASAIEDSGLQAVTNFFVRTDSPNAGHLGRPDS